MQPAGLALSACTQLGSVWSQSVSPVSLLFLSASWHPSEIAVCHQMYNIAEHEHGIVKTT